MIIYMYFGEVCVIDARHRHVQANDGEAAAVALQV